MGLLHLAGPPERDDLTGEWVQRCFRCDLELWRPMRIGTPLPLGEKVKTEYVCPGDMERPFRKWDEAA